MRVFDKTLTALERSLDARLLRHNVLSANIANVDTPGYLPKEVHFEKALQSAREPGVSLAAPPMEPGHIALGLTEAPTQPGVIVQAEHISSGLDGNGVDLDRTMTAMATNSLQYGATARAASKKLSILRYVASDGNG